MTALATAVGSHPSTISAMMYGDRKTNGRLVAKVAVALRMEDRLSEVYNWVGRASDSLASFEPHPDADLLSADERKTINDLIRLLTSGRVRGIKPGQTVDLSRRLREVTEEDRRRADAARVEVSAANETDELQQRPGDPEDG